MRDGTQPGQGRQTLAAAVAMIAADDVWGGVQVGDSAAFRLKCAMKAIQLQVPETLLLDSAQSWAEVERRSQLLLALKYFELGQVTSGQAAAMCGIGRTAFLTEASRLGVPVAELSDDEIEDEFKHV